MRPIPALYVHALGLLASAALAPSMAAAQATAPVSDGAAAPSSTGHTIAVISTPAAPELRAIAGFIIDSAHQQLSADPRFRLADRDAVARARSGYGGADQDLTFAQACLLGRQVDVTSVLLVGGYALDERAYESQAAPVKPRFEPTLLNQTRPGMRDAASPDLKRSAHIGVNLIVVDTDTCKMGESALVGAKHDSPAAEPAVALAEAKSDFQAALREGLQKLFPVRTTIASSAGNRGQLSVGADHGVRAGQYYEVIRDQRLIGHAYVDTVEATSAQVSLVRGADTFRDGDRLAEHGIVRVWEVGVTGTPTLLDRQRGDDALGVAVGVEASMYQPVSSNLYRVMIENLRVDGLSRWRLGVELGRQVRLIPRRLFAYGRLGLGAVTAHQDLVDDAGQVVDGATGRSLEILNAVGLKATFGDNLAVHVSAGYPLLIPSPTWSLDSDHRMDATPEQLTYKRSEPPWPRVTVSAGWRFP